MSDIDASQVSIRTESTDTATGDLVVVVDGVETQRIARPEVKNDLDLTAYLTDTHIPAMRTLKSDAAADITVAQAVKSAAQAAKALPVTSVAEARAAITALANVAIDAADLVIDVERRLKDLATGEIKSSRKLLAELDGQD